MAIGGSDILQNSHDIEKNPEIVICTPGRIVDLMKNSQFVDLTSVEMMIVDEADRMFQLGFKAELDYIMSNINITRQTMLFSATLNKDIKDLARANMNEPVYIDLMGLSIIPNRIKQYYTYIDKKKATKFERIPYLYYWVDSLIGFNLGSNNLNINASSNKCADNNIKMIIFCKTKKCCLLIRVALT